MIRTSKRKSKYSRPVEGVKVEKKTSFFYRLVKPRSRKQSRLNLNSPSASYLELRKPKVEKKVAKEQNKAKKEPVGPQNTPVRSKKLYTLVHNQKVPVMGPREPELQGLKGLKERKVPVMPTEDPDTEPAYLGVRNPSPVWTTEAADTEPEEPKSKGKVRKNKDPVPRKRAPEVLDLDGKIPAWMVDDREPAQPEMRRFKDMVSIWLNYERQIKRDEEAGFKGRVPKYRPEDEVPRQQQGHHELYEYKGEIVPAASMTGETEHRQHEEPELRGLKGLRAKLTSSFQWSGEKHGKSKDLKSKDAKTQTKNPKLVNRAVQTDYSAIERF